MANDCYYQMKLRGAKPNRDAFIRKMNDYDEENHFWRIFQCTASDEGDDYTIIEGDCAWSLETCCRASGYSDGVDLFKVNTEDLNLELDAYSEEPGIGFQEHYIYRNGVCLADECVNMTEYWYVDFPSFEEFKKEHGLPDGLTEDDLIDGEYYRVGGFENWDWRI